MILVNLNSTTLKDVDEQIHVIYNHQNNQPNRFYIFQIKILTLPYVEEFLISTQSIGSFKLIFRLYYGAIKI